METGVRQPAVGLWLGAVMVVVTTWTGAAVARDKTDVVEIKNGDRIHGEIATLQYGKLKLKTDSLGTIYIEWPDVVSVQSRYSFYVESIGGRRHFGALQPGNEPGFLQLIGGAASSTIAIVDVTRIDQVEQGFWDRIDGSFSVGFNYAKSTNISVTSAAFTSSYRSQLHVATLSLDINDTTGSDGDHNNRSQLSYVHQYLLPKGRFWIGGASFERNDELGIDGRLQFAGGFGTYLRQTHFSEVGVYAGLALNQEWTQGTDNSQRTIESFVGSNWRIFRFADPETSLNSSFVVFPSLSQWGRVRSELNVTLRRELIEDLYLDLSLYYSYDNEPPSEDAAKDDHGVVTSVGYSF